jgi:hypothetical protein
MREYRKGVTVFKEAVNQEAVRKAAVSTKNVGIAGTFNLLKEEYT